MRTIVKCLTIQLLITLLLTTTLLAQSFEQPSCPYFQISDSRQLLPLLGIDANVQISGPIARVELMQRYVNRGRRPVEALYVFPGSTQSAVHGLKMTINDRLIEAKIAEREKARRIYTQAKYAGKRASLLEQERPNVFEMNVANIMPGDTIDVTLVYSEMLIPEEGEYEFVLPTVVGPRYEGRRDKGSGKQWVQNPYLSESQLPTYTYQLNLSLRTAIPIQKVASTSHGVNTKFISPSACNIELVDPLGGNRDFILKYRLQEDQIHTGLLRYESAGEKYFALMMQPPSRPLEQTIPGRAYTFLLDVSGSMSGFPLKTARDLMNDLLDDLRPTDRFNLVFFAGDSRSLFRTPQPVTPANIEVARKSLRKARGGGGTELFPALQNVLNESLTDEWSQSVVVVTDGFVTVEKRLFELIKRYKNDLNVFAFGIGSSVNRYVIEGMARTGGGHPFVVESPGAAWEEAKKFRKFIDRPVLTQVDVSFGHNQVYDVFPSIQADLFAERPIVIMGKYKENWTSPITITGVNGKGNWSQSLLPNDQDDEATKPLPLLWARMKIEELDDLSYINSPTREEVMNIGLQYGLLTAYTSFVAVDSEVANASGRSISIQQPLPIPEGVSQNALQFSQNTTSYRQRLGATGALKNTRDIDSGGPDVFLSAVEQNKVVNPIVAIRYESEGNDEVTLEVKNLFDASIHKETSRQGLFWVDLDKLNNEQGFFVFNLADATGSSAYGIRVTDMPGLPLLGDINSPQSLGAYIQIIETYIHAGLLLDAVTAFEVALFHYPGTQSLINDYEEFLLIHGLKDF